MINRLIRNGWWSLHADHEHATKLSDGEQNQLWCSAGDQLELWQ